MNQLFPLVIAVPLMVAAAQLALRDYPVDIYLDRAELGEEGFRCRDPVAS